ncbi:dienelactone hydrolase family protein [Rhodoferax sp.]|uniref:dienelactone hydrolase family protein n=1 Tax=Rhodoferax sp. TaxID=50421 RepID=UPI00283CDDAA|nr:dienelactone hydrolase family protein [Rhodoferax sp.]MDR3367624.1 dienelactone hydrolase family protein [Rhodoferax sp.]
MKRFRFLHALLLAALSVSAYAGVAEQISIPTAGLSSSPAPLVGFLFKPANLGVHPAVVMLHGCGGAYNRQGELGARQRMWGEYLASHGYTALMLDSFSSRGIKEICTVKFGDRTLKEADRVGDAYAALAWLRRQRGVDAKRISLLGWSNGAGVTLEAISHEPKTGAVFNAGVAFYPGCTSRNKRADRFHPYAPLLLLMGESDDWTPVAPCKALADTVASRGEPMQVVLYPDSYHDFDNPDIKTKHVRKEVPNGVHPGEGVTVAPNAQAREAAKQRVIAFLGSPLK